jgi:hypothetical protein
MESRIQNLACKNNLPAILPPQGPTEQAADEASEGGERVYDFIFVVDATHSATVIGIHLGQTHKSGKNSPSLTTCVVFPASYYLFAGLFWALRRKQSTVGCHSPAESALVFGVKKG